MELSGEALFTTPHHVTRPLSHAVRRAGLRLIGRLYAVPARHCDKVYVDSGEALSARPEPGEGPRSILLVRPDHLGDLLFLTPALHALRKALPGARITLLVGPWSADIMRRNPDLDAVTICPFPGFERQPKQDLLAPYRLLLKTARQLHAGGHDTAVVLRFDHWWGAWLAAAAGIPRRVGYDWPETRPFLTEALPYQPGRHEVVQNGTLLAALASGALQQLGPTRFVMTREERDWATAWLAAHGLDPTRPLVSIHPGAGAPVKQWPVAAWAQVANGLIAELDAQILLTGSASEQPLTQALATQISRTPLNAAGQTTPGQLAGLQERCALVLGSDCGPLHLAVAIGTPTVHLYGPVAPDKFGPWGEPARHVALTSDWACAPCDRLDWPARVSAQHRCMDAITPDDVLRAARHVITDKQGVVHP